MHTYFTPKADSNSFFNLEGGQDVTHEDYESSEFTW